MGKEIWLAAFVAATPAFGPVSISVFGTHVPILPFIVSLLALLLSRMIAPPSPRALSTWENVALTSLLCIILFLAVTGEITGTPLKVGMAVVWAIGLGFSGLLIVETLAERVRGFLNAAMGTKGNDNGTGS